MQKSTPIGIVIGLSLIFGAILLGDGAGTFFSLPALTIVLGGTGAALLVNYPLSAFQQIPKQISRFFSFEQPALNSYISQFEDLSRMARREGLLALDKALADVDDDLMRFGLEMTVDGTDADELNEMMEKRIRREARQRRLLSTFCTTAGTYAPAFGMIGTLIGLIQMMQNLDDPTQIGAGMATAMVTTFYGALLANLIFLPMAAKAKSQMQQTMQAREVVRYGVLSIVQGDSPRMVRQRLSLFVKENNQDTSAPVEAESAETPPMSKAA